MKTLKILFSRPITLGWIIKCTIVSLAILLAWLAWFFGYPQRIKAKIELFMKDHFEKDSKKK